MHARPNAALARTALAALLAAAAMAGGCATPPATAGSEREDLRNRVELAAKCLDIADYAASVFEQECARALLEQRPSREIAILQYNRNTVKATVRALALNPDPAFAIVDLYVWSQLAQWACGNRMRLNPQLQPDNCEQTYGLVRARIAQVAAKVIDAPRRLQLDNIVADYQEGHADRVTIGTLRLPEIVDSRRSVPQVIEDVTPTMLSPITDASRQLEQTRLLGMQLVWLLARMPVTMGEEVEATARVLVESEPARDALQRLDGIGGRMESAGTSMTRVAEAQAQLAKELAGVHESLDGISRSVDTLGGAQRMSDRVLAGAAAIGAGLVLLATLGALLVVRAARGGQGRSGSA